MEEACPQAWRTRSLAECIQDLCQAPFQVHLELRHLFARHGDHRYVYGTWDAVNRSLPEDRLA
eukprot:5392428-Alexandrium_andersonii.AAC.1